MATMTREEKLRSMNAKMLQELGAKLGVKITNSDIKKGKGPIIVRIMAAEKALAEAEAKAKAKKSAKKPVEETVEDVIGKETADLLKNVIKDVTTAVEEPVQEVKTNTKAEPKKANLKLNELTYNGKTQSIKEWAAEINMPWPTLYDRVNRNGWPVDLAIETPLGQRRPKNKEA